MLLRLLLAIVAACLSLPATATPACHPAREVQFMVMPSDHMPGERHAPEAAHVCIGCAPVADWLRASIDPPLLLPTIAPLARETRLDIGAATPPALPPPRAA